MGIIKAVVGSIGGGLADQWLEVIEPNDMSDTTVFTSGVKVRSDDRRGQNRKGSDNIVSNGSVVHVYPNQFMMMVEGGKILDYTAEEGYYIVNNSSMPSLFNGQLLDSVKESFQRIKFGGVPSSSQKVYYINLQEIKGIKFGTRNPVNYFDSFYNSELFLRAHGTYSIKIVDPIRFYAEAIPRNKDRVDIEDIYEQYMSEFLEALQAAINQMSADGVRISYVASKSRDLSKYMSGILDEEWNQSRGMEIQSVGIASISYDEASTKLINIRNQGAITSDPVIREGYVQGTMAEALKEAASNPNGSVAGFMGMGLGVQTGGNLMEAASQFNQKQMEKSNHVVNNPLSEEMPGANAESWKCNCGAANTGKFCTECGSARPDVRGWICSCGVTNYNKFCSECGKQRPEKKVCRCSKCGYEPDENKPLPKFCPNCGDPINEDDMN